MNVTGNQMVMEHFQDWYYLEALRANITMAVSRRPELAFSHAVEKLSADVENEFARLSHSIALRVYVYIWTAALGEARHADYCEYKLAELKDANRFSCYGKALSFFPGDENLQTLKDVFDQRWISSFGGRAWLEIVNALDFYGNLSDVAFIDHCIDLEHNSGTVFNKPTLDVTNFNTSGANDLRTTFLDYKFTSDILRDNPVYYKWDVSRRVYTMIVRFSNIIERIAAVDFCRPTLETLSDYSVEWGFETLTLTDGRGGGDENNRDDENRDGENRVRCDWCGKPTADDNAYWIECHTYCESCYDEKFGSCKNCGNVYRVDELHCMKTDEDTWVVYCDECKERRANYCKECDKWTENMEYHNQENHQNENDIPEGFVQTEKTYKIFWDGENTITTKVLEIPESGLFVFSLKAAAIELGKTHENKWGVMTKCGLWYTGKDATMSGAMATLIRTKDIIDWNTIHTKEDWISLDSQTIEKVKKEVYV